MTKELKTDYKYIYFLKIYDMPKTSVWHCRARSNDCLLGTVKWYCPWRQYSFFPKADTVFNVSCNEDINDFIGQLSQ